MFAPLSNGRRLFSSGDIMTIIKRRIKTSDTKHEVRPLRETARKIAASKESARSFLIATGMYSANGEINPQYR